jgi:pyruvate/2-oxoglutarate dehydrogenase complex dihydrolipoamide dehydrogenase (E3) component
LAVALMFAPWMFDGGSLLADLAGVAAGMFRRFGSRVSIIQRGPQLMDREDADVAEAVREILVEDGLDVHLDADVLSAGRGQRTGEVVLNLALPGGPLRLEGSHILVATGRTPNVDDLNLDAAGVETDDAGNIRVNERLETGVPGIYAMGDVKGGPAFTHIAYDDYRVLKRNLLENGDATWTRGRFPTRCSSIRSSDASASPKTRRKQAVAESSWRDCR